MKVVDHEGNNFLGGTDFDNAIIDKIVIPYLSEKWNIPDLEEQMKTGGGSFESLYYELLYKCEEAKKELSFQPETYINITIAIDEKVYDENIRVDCAQFESIIQPQIALTIAQLQKILQRNNLRQENMNDILLVGGSTYIPLVKRMLAVTGIPVNSCLDPTTAVVIGAAYYAANKYYHPKDEVSKLSVEEVINTTNLNEDKISEEPKLNIQLSYSKMSKDSEEVMIVKVIGDIEGLYFRIIRNDGGFDTGMMPLKEKFTDFLPLLPGINNIFYLRIFDAQQHELKELKKEITISQGQFNIQGQPLPQDVCIEVDDKENKTTKLEVVFERNSVLPQKKSLYREISKTIKQGSDDFITINLMEGDRHARPLSNLIIGMVKISGKDLTSDLIKGSDIELQIKMTDSRELHTEVYLVMTNQEFKNVFSVSEKHIDIDRLKEQFIDLENEIRNSIKLFSYEENDVWAIQAAAFLNELDRHKEGLNKLTVHDNTDRKYVIAEAIRRISQEYDKLGGEDRLEQLRAQYLDLKDQAEQHLPGADFRKEELKGEFNRMIKNEHAILISRNPSRLEKAIEAMNDFIYKVLMNNTSYLISQFETFKNYPESYYTNYNGAKAIFNQAQKALDKESYFEFRQHVYNITHLFTKSNYKAVNDNFKGTGIG